MAENIMSRRGFVSAAGAAGVLAACGFAGKTVYAAESKASAAASKKEVITRIR